MLIVCSDYITYSLQKVLVWDRLIVLKLDVLVCYWQVSVSFKADYLLNVIILQYSTASLQHPPTYLS